MRAPIKYSNIFSTEGLECEHAWAGRQAVRQRRWGPTAAAQGCESRGSDALVQRLEDLNLLEDVNLAGRSRGADAAAAGSWAHRRGVQRPAPVLVRQGQAHDFDGHLLARGLVGAQLDDGVAARAWRGAEGRVKGCLCRALVVPFPRCARGERVYTPAGGVWHAPRVLPRA